MKCRSCGADNSPSTTVCSHCGSHLPLISSSKKAAVFARIKASDAYAARDSAERIARLPNASALQKVFLHLFLAIFIGTSAMMALFLLGMAGAVGIFGFQSRGGMGAAFSFAPLLMAVVPMAFVAVGIFMFRHLSKKMNALENDPVTALPVILVGKRTEVSGGSGDSSSHTSYFMTCEAEDGSREEYQVWDGKLYGKLADDDAGVIFLRAGYGLDFDRVVVD